MVWLQDKTFLGNSLQGPRQHQILARMWSNRNSHWLLVGMQKETATLKHSLTVFYKAEYTLIIWSSNCAPWCLSKYVENLRLHKNLHEWIFVVSLSMITTTWKQSRCPSVGEPTNCGAASQWNTLHWAIKPWKDVEEIQMHMTQWNQPVWRTT